MAYRDSERQPRRFGRGGGGRTFTRFGAPGKCRYCRAKAGEIDYKDVQGLQKLTTVQGKLFSRKRSGNCARHQRSAKIALKRARFMALLPYVA
ncbi:MAG: 30S ribosomal protein S18 [Planctomycetes bacterium]|nr:30S ribosomal protein S18 [Planctomycetota bacterium]